MTLQSHWYYLKRRLIQGILSTTAIVLLSLGESGADTLPSPPVDLSKTKSITPETVDCLLPNQIRSMGEEGPSLAPRRKVNITPDECQKRGGEVLSDKPAQ